MSGRVIKVAAPLIAVVVLLAGCSESSQPEVQEIIVESTPEPEADAVEAPPEPPRRGQKGHLAGFVVDQTLRPIQGAEILLPGIDFVDESDRDGSFSFADLNPGSYLIRATYKTHLPVESLIKIDAGKFTRVKFVLKQIPPPSPYHETVKFSAHASVTSTLLLPTIFGASGSDNRVAVGENLTALVVEATMDPYAGIGGGENSFEYSVRDPTCCARYKTGNSANPLLVVVDRSAVADDATEVSVQVLPQSFPAPETSKDYEIFVTAFYHAEPPLGWSFVQQEGV